MSLFHGGDIAAAAKQFAFEITDCLDLSTGINPSPYPVEGLESCSFHHLPYLSDDFYQAVRSYYGDHDVAVLPGSQAAIPIIADLVSAQANYPVLMPELGYQEHAFWWQHKTEVNTYSSLKSNEMLDDIHRALDCNHKQHLLIINPNNPTGLKFDIDCLLALKSRLDSNAYLIVDEAFLDLEPSASLLNLDKLERIVVLRSFGKFFGLAGVRLGFCFADKKIIDGINERLGIWPISGPAQTLAIKALNDQAWQKMARSSIRALVLNMRQCLLPLENQLGFSVQNVDGLFLTYIGDKDQVEQVFQVFAKRAILLRLIDFSETKSLLRIGLCELDASNHHQRLSAALNAL